jgi:ubiquinone/menaquinone biosynthesis C-methylase UbiE
VLFLPTHVAVLDAAAEAGMCPREVLDLGCGTGRLLERAAQRWANANLIGIDVSAKMIDEARRKHPGQGHFRFEIGDVAALPLEPASVDLAVSTISFHHWADQLGGLRQVARVLRPGGIFVLADIHPPLVLRPIMRAFHASRSRRKLFEGAGLRLVGERRPLRIAGQVLITVGSKTVAGKA